jgi:type IV secretory pathway TrbD component
MSIPLGYVIGLAVLAFPVLRLPRVPMSLGTSVFFLTMSINELPVLATLAFGASTALALAEGDLASPVAVGAAVVAAACLGLQVWRGARALLVLRRAMGPIEVSGRLPLWRVLVFPFAVRPRSVERLHGTHDSLVPVVDARRFAERLRADSRNLVVYAELPGAHHGFDLYYSPRFTAVVNAVEAFAAEAFAKPRPVGEVSGLR